jgi:DNA-binding LacI/PurR family transcriptional regulator
MQTKRHVELANSIGLSHRRIAQLAGCTPTTVDNVLGPGRPAFSKATEQKIFKVIQEEAEKTQKNLARLMGEA